MGIGDGGASPSPANRGRGRGPGVPVPGQIGDGDGGASPSPAKSGTDAGQIGDGGGDGDRGVRALASLPGSGWHEAPSHAAEPGPPVPHHPQPLTGPLPLALRGPVRCCSLAGHHQRCHGEATAA